MRGIVLGWALVAVMAARASAADWIKIASPNFEIYSSAREPETRATLETLERARDFFLRLNPTMLPPREPVPVVQFGTRREYEPYRMSPNVRAYLTGDWEHDMIVIGDVDLLGARAVVHEYVHVLVKHSGLRIPRWLNEGLADVYSTLEERDGRVVVGAIPSYRTNALASSNWMRLDDLVEVVQTSEKDEAERVNVFYAQSWLLAHMLLLGDGYREKFREFLRHVSEDGSQEAFSQVYGKSLAEIQAAMNAYFRGNTIGAQRFIGDLRKVEIGPATPVPAADVEAVLMRLKGYLNPSPEQRMRRVTEARPAAERPPSEPLPPEPGDEAAPRPVLRRAKQAPAKK